jgi:hypothetical protein
MRAPGVALHKMPLFSWAVLVTAILLLLSLPVLAGSLYCPFKFIRNLYTYLTVCWEDLGILWNQSLVTNLSNVLTPGKSAGTPPGLDLGFLRDYTLDSPYTTVAAALRAVTSTGGSKKQGFWRLFSRVDRR